MPSKLSDILDLVGTLDDTPGDDTPRERFRRFLRRRVEEIGYARDLVEECLRESDLQYAYALQDLVNRLGELLGFEVEYGRYQGVSGEIGHDGLWESPTQDFHVVVETKTSEQFHIKTAKLTGYVDELISERRVPDWNRAMGLYVIGEPDPEVRQLENAIVAENKTNQLRIVSLEALLLLAELMSEYDVTHTDVLDVVRPSGPTIDPIVNLMFGIAAEEQVRQETAESRAVDGESSAEQAPVVAEPGQDAVTDEDSNYWLAPVSSKGGMSSEEVIRHLIGKKQVYGFGKRTPGRKELSPGDQMAFYASGQGVVAHAEVTARPEKKENPEEHLGTPDAEEYPYIFGLRDPKLYLDDPVAIDESVRESLDAFEGRDLSKPWSWFVMSTGKVSEHDFEVLTRR